MSGASLYYEVVSVGEPIVLAHGLSLDSRMWDGQVDAYSGWHWLNPDMGRAMSPPAISRLGQIHVPTLVIVGELDIPDFHNIAATQPRVARFL